MKKANSKNQKIVIEIDKEDKTTVNIDWYVDGKLQDMDFAFCHPDDTFVFSIGAELAFNRILEKIKKAETASRKPKVGDEIILVGNQTFKVIAVDENGTVCVQDRDKLRLLASELYEVKSPARDEDFRIGELVRFRSWNDMMKEFGCNSCGHIDCSWLFLTAMKPLCGTTARFKGFIGDTKIKLDDFSVDTSLINPKDFFYSVDMIEKIKEEK